MFGVLLALFFAGLLVVIVRTIQEPDDKNPVLQVLLIGYVLRLIVRTFNRDLVLFSDGQAIGGGDATIYEYRASLVAWLWERTGAHFTTTAEVPELANVPLPPNLFAFVEYFNGGYSAIGNVSIVAFMASLTGLVLYRTYIKYDPERMISFRFTCYMFFIFSFVAMTSDAFKDGMLVFFSVSVFSILVLLNRDNYYWLLPALALCLLGIDGIRYYLLYAMLPSILIRFVGFQQQRLFNFGTAAVGLGAFLLIGLNFSQSNMFMSGATELFESSYNYNAQISNMSGGSGVDIDGGKPTLASLPIKILYTLFAPFPWQGGSLGLHLSKIEMIFWYYLLYWAYRGSRSLLRRDPMMVMMFLSFIVGMLVVYAWSFTNIGLMYRVRIPMFFVASILSVWGRVIASQEAKAVISRH